MGIVDITFDFTTDTPYYWDAFWERNHGLGAGGNDPDVLSKTLQKYQQVLWSRELPNGEIMELSTGGTRDYLTWREFRFGSDSIVTGFRYNNYRSMLNQIQEKAEPNYKEFVEGYLRKSYTIGGEIIFPKRSRDSINQARGLHPQIKDRWDLTLECIRRFYLGEESPLYKTLVKDKEFFDLFIDFKGYVDFFFLHDCVSADYRSVHFWLGNGDFADSPLPKTVDDYFRWMEKNLEFVRNRNKRIQEYCKGTLKL